MIKNLEVRTGVRTVVTATAPALTRVEVLDARVTAADPGARTITGLVVQWGAIGRTSIGPCRFARGSISAPEPRRVKLMVEHDVAQVVGYLTAAQDTDQGLVGTFTVPPGAAGDAVLASAAAGLRDGLSVGVEVDAAAPGADGVLDVTAGQWRETSVVAIPAFMESRVTQVAATGQPGLAFGQAAQQATQVALQTAAGAPTAVSPAAPQLWSPQGQPVAATYVPAGQPWQARPVQAMGLDQAIDRITAGWRNGGAEGALRAALTDIVPPTDPGQAQSLFRPQWLGELWSTSYHERPLIDCLSKAPLTSFTVSGFQVTRPVFGVAPYTGNKTAVPSPGGYAVVPVSTTAQRIAGAHDIDRAFIDLGDGSFVANYFRYQAENYAVLTEDQVETWLATAATPITDAAAVDVLTSLDVLAQYFATLGGGARMSFVAIAPDLWSALIGTKNLDAPWLYGGSASLVGGTATVGGISIFLANGIPDGTIMAGDRRAATFYEWKNPPLGIQAVNIANGGIDLGVFGYVAHLVNNPAALVTITPTAPAPPPEADAPARSRASK
jgi:HK97 family phage prohead protease